MNRKGGCWDNSPTERFFSSLKREWLIGNQRAAIADMTPIEFEKNLAKCLVLFDRSNFTGSER